jgi:Protein of unknown function (DUF1822)
MLNLPANSTDIRLLLPESIWLESEHFQEAKKISDGHSRSVSDRRPAKSDRVNDEADKWQSYLNALALLGFEEWLSKRINQQPINRDFNNIETASYLKVGEFKFCLIATENILDEEVILPTNLIETPELAAHFYVLLEVLEEEEEVIIRGFLRYDELVNSTRKLQSRDSFYRLPLAEFDPEPNHLLFYSRFLEPTAIPLPVTTQTKLEENLVLYFQETTTKLSQWLQGVIDESWHAIDTLLSPEVNLAFSTRNIEVATKRGKLIDLGIQLSHQSVALIVNIIKESEDKICVSTQLHPTGKEKYLPPNIKLTLLSKAGNILQQVEARGQDNYIQLKRFKGERGKRFSIEVNLGDLSVRENFEL